MSIADQAAAQLPFKVTLFVKGMDRDVPTHDTHLWCEENCEGEVRYFEETTWRNGPGWNLIFRFTSERDATLFKLFHDGAV